MLVLSRRQNQKVIFPTLGVTVEVCALSKNSVRLGIVAPPSIPIFREEIMQQFAAKKPAERQAACHAIRNRLHTAHLAVHLAQKQLQAGLEEQAHASLAEALREFALLDQELGAGEAQEMKAQRSIRALVVEDNGNERTLLAELLRLHGVKVETACDGQAALDHLKANARPDVILLDMRMPRCDGPAMIAALREDRQYDALKVFAVTGADPGECGLQVGPRGVDGWFTKPINPAKLIHEMNVSLGRN